MSTPFSGVILTDYPKTRSIDAHLRGVPTEILKSLLEKLFHSMMEVHTEEAGGYVIWYKRAEIEKELLWRGER